MGSPVKPFWKVRVVLTLCDDILLYNNRLVEPPPLHNEILSRIHEGQQGIERCRMRVRQSVWWPGASNQAQQFAGNCLECAKHARQQREPLLPAPLPNYPWQVVATDLFEIFLSVQHLIVVDYFSRYPELHM